MIKIKHLTCRNFMSVGNVTQAIDFDRRDLTLVLGENLDLGGDDAGARNGTGKTTIINALSYGMYGQALTNIKRDNLINKTNGKGMLVTIDFEKDGVPYRIERGRKPGVMVYYIGDVAQKSDDNDAQGDSRETQATIERLLGMSHDMFRHIVALNTYTQPFLSLKAGEQRAIIEQLLGITLLSEKADALKEQTRITKDAMAKEEIRIKAVTDANERIKEQIASLRRRQSLWKKTKDESLAELVAEFDKLTKIDIDTEIQNHKLLAEYNEKVKILGDLRIGLQRVESDLAREEKAVSKLTKELALLEEHRCYACGQDLHDSTHQDLLVSKTATLKDNQAGVEEARALIDGIKAEITAVGEVGEKPTVYYRTEKEVFNHQMTVEHLIKQIEAKNDEMDPYEEQIVEMEEKAIEEVSFDTIDKLSKLKEHQEFLHKLLTNKDSFIRKKIIDQNLSYLNARLGQYLNHVGLPHTVQFNNDLTVDITELSRELDFDNLSRGERNRLILSLSWAFRDVWETLYHPINLLFVDELIDSGMDSNGVEASMGVLKRMARDYGKSVWLISHKDDLVSRVNNILRVVKENGFTNFSPEVEQT